MKKYDKTISTNVDNVDLSLTIYEVANPKAIIQVVHGMCEHKERFEPLALSLVNEGYTVILSDLRGHGKSISNEKTLGYFGKNGYKNMINDQFLITNFIKINYPNNNIYIFAHSMGTIIIRNYLQIYAKLVNKVILCGAPCYQKGARIGLVISSILSIFNSKKPSKFLAKLSTGPFNKCVTNPLSENDWITYNYDNVIAYNNNPLCGFYFTTKGYNTLYRLVIRMNKKNLYKSMNKNDNLKILFIAGKDDPCTGGEFGIKSSIKVLNKAGYADINYILYENMRHEVLNERNNDHVYNDIKNFFNK